MIDPSRIKLVETVTLKKFIGDQSDPNNCTEVIVTENGVPVAHWKKILVAEGDQVRDHWTRTDKEDRDEAIRIADGINKARLGNG